MSKSITQLKAIRSILYFCNGESCRRQGSEELTASMRNSIKRAGLGECVHTVKTLCAGFCEVAPVITVHPQNQWYGKVSPEGGDRIVTEHLLEGEPVLDLLYPQKD